MDRFEYDYSQTASAYGDHNITRISPSAAHCRNCRIVSAFTFSWIYNGHANTPRTTEAC